MAKKVVTTTEYYDDFDDKPIQEGLVETIKYSWDGDDYTIDLRPENASKFRKDMEKWVAASAKEAKTTRRRRTSTTTGTRPDTSSGRSKEELAAIRDWWRSQGNEIADRGRVAQHIQEAFDEAHASKAS
ncbi:histone-like nucleoid-structuring protein Lsr2 [Rhodococcus qingshengii]|uniref:histone-like nucleoid-structuring protein Lsr2 n=1 Tax=Rhodococcus qingshengii TaxID=334542 RepID=UPI0029420158|nr:Lsr2 family protein [Rhodococcus qingshengii]WOI86005.1 Lsr2 family protein [Rhodococcus qingshengii]